MSGIFVKFVVAGSDVSALALAFWRDLVTFGVLVSALVLFRPAWLRVDRRDLVWFVGLGVSLGGFHVLWNLGVLLNGAAVATVQQATMPAIVACVAWLIWREPLSARKLAAIGLTFVGTLLVSGINSLAQAQVTLSGFLIGLAMPVGYAAWTLFGKKVRDRYSAMTALAYGFGFAALVLLPFQVFTPQPWPVPVQAGLWFIGLIGIATVLPFFVYTWALGRLQAGVAGILAMAEIPIVAVYAYVLLGEQLDPEQVLGAVLVIVGVMLLSRRVRADSRVRGDAEAEGPLEPPVRVVPEDMDAVAAAVPSFIDRAS